MLISKHDPMAERWFHLVDPSELDNLEEWTFWLEAILHNPCSICERDGEEFLIENKQLVARLNGLKIEISSAEHPPPHFHVKSPEVNATFAIEDCRQLTGSAPPAALRKIFYWHRFSKTKLIEVWNATRPTGCTVGNYIGA
jgi:hypothetical protein